MPKISMIDYANRLDQVADMLRIAPTPISAIAEKFGVTQQTARNWIAMMRERYGATESTGPGAYGRPAKHWVILGDAK